MAFTNQETKEVHCKVLYCGPPGAGKRENLRSIYRENADDLKSGIMELEDQGCRFRYFDFLPVSLGHVRGYHIKLHLFTLPEQCLFDSVSEIILTGVDGVVFIADSRIERLSANIEHFRELRRLLQDRNCRFPAVPGVVQYNKRDLDEIFPADILRQELNPLRLPEFEAIARRSVGTLETLHAMAKQVLMAMVP